MASCIVNASEWRLPSGNETVSWLVVEGPGVREGACWPSYETISGRCPSLLPVFRVVVTEQVVQEVGSRT